MAVIIRCCSKKEFDRLIHVDTSNVYADIEEVFLGKTGGANLPLEIPLVAYALYLMQAHPELPCGEFYTFCNSMRGFSFNWDNIEYVMDVTLSEGDRDRMDGISGENVEWADILKLRWHFTQDELAACLLFGDGSALYTHVPEGVAELAYRLLKIKKNDIVADASVTDGTFLAYCTLNHPEMKAVGYPVDMYETAVAQARADFIGADYFLEEYGMFPLDQQDKIFCNFPAILEENDFFVTRKRHLTIPAPELPENTSIEWLYSKSLLGTLNRGGKMVAIMNAGCLSSRNDWDARKYFVGNGLIEEVIILPEKLYLGGRRRLALVSFSRNNRSIHFVNAEHKARSSRLRGKKVEILDAENLEDILSTDSGLTVSASRVKKQDYSLEIKHFYPSAEAKLSTNSIKLCDLHYRIFRGAQLSFSACRSSKETDCIFIMPRNIQNGFITVPYDKYIRPDIAEKKKAYEIHDGDILLERIGYKTLIGDDSDAIHFNVAIYDGMSDKKCFANEGLYILRHDEQYDEDPYYIKAFLESSAGQKKLALSATEHAGNSKKEYHGGILLPIDKLKQLEIPWPSKAQRIEIGNISRKLSAKYSEARLEINAGKEKLSGIFNDEMYFKEEEV